MISRIRAGILSCIGLIFINLLRGFVLIPSIDIGNLLINKLIIQIGYLLFTLSLWIVLKYVLVKLNDLKVLEKPLNWLIRNLAIVTGVSICSNFFPNRELYFIIIILGLILIVNYIIVFVKLYRLDKDDLEFIGDLDNYMISTIVLIIVYLVIGVIDELKWHKELEYLFYFFSAIPIIFQMRFLLNEKRDVEKKLSRNSID